jgi:predicted transcriptional regulator
LIHFENPSIKKQQLNLLSLNYTKGTTFMTDLTNNTNELLGYASRIVSAYVSNHTIAIEEIPAIVAKVFQSLSEICRNPHTYKSSAPIVPACPIEESVNEEYIVCLEDGKKLQMLKRHLSTVYGMSLDQYKERWGLPMDYPVVSPSYARRRSAIAKKTGLGTTGRKRKIKVIEGAENQYGQSQAAVIAS